MSEREWRELIMKKLDNQEQLIIQLIKEVATLKASARVQSSIFGGLAGLAPLVFERLLGRN